MKLLKRILLLLMVLVISLTFIAPVEGYDQLVPLVRNSSEVKHYQSTEKVMIPNTYDENTTEFRGVWVATVYNLNMPKHSSETQYKAAFNDLIDELLESNMNAMLFQVRPLNDALYDSDYAPFSRYLTGTEGTNPGWDTLTWMINECHANGIEFHAWMNPYRVANTTSTQAHYLGTLDDSNFAKLHPELVISGNVDSNGRNPLILNPGEPAVKEYIRNVVKEIITDYDVDGVHFDDYFYPYSGMSNDVATYNMYKEAGQSIENWRRENVNDVVQGIKEDIDLHNETESNYVRFGISPFGLWGSNVSPTSSKYLEDGSNTGASNMSSYHSQYADSKKWVEEGWVHYICPQVYFSFTHSTAPYADVVDWWASIARGTGVDVVIGHAPSSASSQNWTTEEISDQLRYNQQHPEIVGSVMYSAAYLDSSHMQYIESHNWTVTPAKAWETTATEISVSVDGTLYGNLYIDDIDVTLEATDSIYYKLDDGDWTLYSSSILVSGTGAHVLYMKTMDVNNVESPVISENFPIQYINTDVPTIYIVGTQIGDNYVVGSTINADASKDVYIRINHGSIGDWVLYTEPITLDGTGGYSVYAKTIDSRGTSSEEVQMTATIQEECYDDPIITLSGTGNDPFYKELTVTLSSDTSMMYKINDGAYMEYTSPIVFNTDGLYTIYYKNNDSCGTVLSREFTIDNIAPADATISIDGEYDGVRYYTSTTTVTLNALANETIKYRVHDGSSWTSWTTYTTPIELIFSGNFYVAYQVIDQAGNATEVTEAVLRLDLPINEENIFVIRDGKVVTYYDSNTAIELPSYTEKTEEIRAVWIATVGNIDIKTHSSEEQYKTEIIKMLNTIEENNFNTVFFQVRPMNDAFYDSDYAPWSRYLTGTEGEDPGWDVLEFMIEESHKRGIEFHAWMNPYRVSTGTTSKELQLSLLADDNFAKMNPDLVIADESGKLILNPGERQVQVFIEKVIRELIAKYDVDGIHFDDYFYSYGGTPVEADADNYNNQKDAGESLADWRRDNINTVVREIFEIIEEHNTDKNKTVLFGISPFGIWGSSANPSSSTYLPDGSYTGAGNTSSYHSQYADSKKWVEEGWVHYILPQLYWEFDHNTAPFADLVDWWAKLCADNDVDLIIGQGFYRYDNDSWDNTNELPEQLRYISQYDSIIGSSFFSYRSLNSLDKESVEALERLNNYYWTDYVSFPWESTVEKQVDPICTDDQTLVDGECVANVPVCTDDQLLQDGKCVLKPVVCEDDYVLQDGECVLEEPVDPVEPDTGCFGSIGAGSVITSFFVGIIGIVSLGIGRFLLHDKRN